MLSLKTMIQRAEKAGACSEGLTELRKCKTLREVKKHPKAAEWAYWYACDVIKGRWPEAESVIAKDPRWAYRYARDVIKGRWPEAEPVIAKNSEWAYYYALRVIKGRWPEAGITL